MASQAPPISAICSPQPLPITLAERERQREIASYFAAASITPNSPATGLRVQPSISPDHILTGLTQLGAIRLNSNRAFVSLIDGKHQYIVAEATKTVSIKDSKRCRPGDEVYLGTTALDIDWGVCPGTMRLFTDETGKLAIDTKNITADTSRYIIRDFQADPAYSERPYVKGWPYMRCYVEVPLISPAGYVIGSYCIVDDRLRDDLDDECVSILTETSIAIMEHLENMRIKTMQSRTNRLLEGLGMFMDGDSCLNSTARMHKRQRKGLLRVGEPDSSRGALPIANFQSKDAIGTFTLPDSGTASSFLSSSDGIAVTPSTVHTNTSSLPLTTPDSGSPDPIAPLDPKKNPKAPKQPVVPQKSRKRSIVKLPNSRQKQSVVTLEIQNIVGVAGSLIRDSMDISGVVFLDAHSTHRKTATDLASPSKQCREASLTTHSALGTEDTEDQMVCAILGLSLSAQAANEDLQDEDLFNLPERLLQQMIDSHPNGRIFSADEFGLLSDKEIKTAVPDLMSPYEPNTSQRSLETSKFFEAFEGSRSIIFLPLWDVQRAGFFAAIIAWTTDFERLFGPTDLTYLSAFGNSIMAEVARVEAMATSRAKSDFISSLSHEIRSPLHGILASSELLRESLGPSTHDHVSDMVAMIESCGNTLLDTLTNLLDFAKINSLLKPQSSNPDVPKKLQEVDVRMSIKQDVDMSLLVQDVIEGVYLGFNGYSYRTSPNMDQHSRHWIHSQNPSSQDGVTQDPPLVTFDIENRPSWILELDVGAWKRIVMNVFGNAIKYTPGSGTIQTSLRIEAMPGTTNAVDAICFEVADTGMSSQYQKDHLFKPFAQENTLSVGTGLGLSIVHQLVTSLKGIIEVESEAGVGTRVKISVPLVKAPPARIVELDLPNVSSSIQSRHICIIVPPTDSSPDDNNAFNTSRRTLSLQNSLKTLLKDWFGANVTLDTEIGRTEADLYITEESTLHSSKTSSVLRGTGAAGHELAPLLVLRSNSHGGKPNSGSDGRKVIFMRYPVGPKKMATFLKQVFDGAVASEPQPSTTALEEPLSEHNHTGADIDTSNDEEAVTEALVNGTKSSFNTSKLEEAMAAIHITDVTSPIPAEISLEPITSLTSAPIPPSPSDPPAQHVLCVDDNAINLKIITTTVKKLSLTCAAAINGLDALNAYKATPTPFTTIFMDINMPIMDGFEATRNIREYERANQLPHCQIVALTGLGSASSQHEALNCGVDLFLTKPVPMKTLKGILGGTVGKRENG
ncbi:uncharacterized protein BDZ99DRAFT_565051 [Mytilinidion resinicola]|uniref:Sensor histidine kinase-like protein/response regulator n=1 Tax=Mytilinidion resinicola TaxID=574789 RepID=A0A6A6Z976_9PEZI|nr:uncharacterized protein BDZ99DRAFT_565051 [Mytilinidion resinicola]KAF2817283.1 hypothetical protein BDZ99DRAFT_565051 [Mytilinidion resinicola]